MERVLHMNKETMLALEYIAAFTHVGLKESRGLGRKGRR